MQLFKRTPEEAFQNIESFDYKTHYIANLVNKSSEYKDFRIAYIDENTHSKNGTLLFIHGHPTWSYLWRHLIPIALKQDYRVLAIDLPGFGKSDKPIREDFFTFKNFRDILLNFIDQMNLKNLTLVLHEWGGTLGLTLPMEHPEKYLGVICFNSYLNNNLVKLDSNYLNWIETNITNDDLNVRALMARTNRILKLSECNAYEAPFPDKSYKLALKKLPSIFPVSKETEGYEISLKAEEWWKQNITTKCMLIGSAKDPIIPLEKMKILSQIIATDEVTHVINNAGHFVPEWGMEFGEELFRQLKDG